jgi:Cd2+/Zn2+-exporting ATPase
MNRVVKQNITFAVAVIFLLICSNFLQVINLPFGVVGHEGSTILVILNGLRLLRSVAGEKGRTETPSSKWRLTEGLNRQASVSKN